SMTTWPGLNIGKSSSSRFRAHCDDAPGRRPNGNLSSNDLDESASPDSRPEAEDGVAYQHERHLRKCSVGVNERCRLLAKSRHMHRNSSRPPRAMADVQKIERRRSRRSRIGVLSQAGAATATEAH